MGVNSQLRRRGRSRSGKDERRLVGFHRDIVAAFSGAVLQELLPEKVTAGAHRSFPSSSLQNHDVLNLVAGVLQCVIDDFFQPSVLALAIGDISREDQPRAARLNAIAQRLGAKAGKHHGVNRADAHRRQHQDDRLRRGWHVDGEAVALLNPHPAQRFCHLLDFVQQMGIGVHAPLATLVDVN